MEHFLASSLNSGDQAVITGIVAYSDGDPVAKRLRNLGFVEGEEFTLVTYGPLGKDPILFQIGFTRFALRESEASRLRIKVLPKDN